MLYVSRDEKNDDRDDDKQQWDISRNSLRNSGDER